ncbi:MAG TPA: VWA domain-containing protein [Vicinamibacteria bacterium]|nr:VWA domain-containing protein [Vicinamibacteria bacterium]
MLPLILALLGQSPAPPALVERTVAVSVVDEKGNGVDGLTAQDLAIQEGGVWRELVRVEQDRRPLTVAVLVDSSQPMASLYRLHVTEALTAFLLRLPEGSRYAIWTTGDRARKIYDYGSDRAAATRALRRVMPQGGNMLYDALVEASKDLSDKEAERAAIVVVTGLGVGFANYSRERVVEALERAGVPVLSVAIEEVREPSPTGFSADDRLGAADYEYVLANAARKTDGFTESTLSGLGLDTALHRVSGELHGRYRLTYLGPPGDRQPKLEVTVARPGAKVRVGSSRR